MGVFLAAFWLGGALPGLAQTGGGEGTVTIDRLVFRYGREHPALPPIEELSGLKLTEDAPLVERGDAPVARTFTADTLRRVAEGVVTHLNRRGLYGVWVAFDDLAAVEGKLVDRRAAGETIARVVVWASQLAEVRTLARGARIPGDRALNHRKHAWIAARSPLQARSSANPVPSLFERDRLETYLRALSTHPGRRVEASVASAGEPGLIVLDYLVTEARAWQVFSQISNTGTDATGLWRGRLGLQHTQFTNHDDVLSADVLGTPDLSNVAAFMSYRLPLIRPSRLSVRVYGSFGDFAADGQAFENLRFVGDNWMGGAEITYRRDLWRAWELALNLGANYSTYSVATNVGPTSITSGESSFLVPFGNVVLTRASDWWSLVGGIRVEQSVAGVANDDPSRGFGALGRMGATASWTSLRGAVEFRSFLEPLLFRAATQRTLAHEVLFKLRGRFLPGGGRLIPQEQDLVGGASSVRGYPESVVSGDEAMTFTAEYAFHVPWSLRSGDAGTLLRRPFAWRPSASLRRPDWDLVLRTFFDYGQRLVEKMPSSTTVRGEVPLAERDLTLMGAGAGVELAVKQAFSLRCDVGMALLGLGSGEQRLTRAGDVRAHVAANFFW